MTESEWDRMRASTALLEIARDALAAVAAIVPHGDAQDRVHAARAALITANDAVVDAVRPRPAASEKEK